MREKIVEICEARKPLGAYRDGSRGCSVYGCEGKKVLVVEVGGGLPPQTNSHLIALCRKHAAKLRADLCGPKKKRNPYITDVR